MNNIEDIYSLSPMQQGMLFHTLYSPESEVYFEQLVCTLKGQLNLSFFQEAWQKIVAKYPVLRSSFHWEEIEKPLQIVSQIVELPWMVYDWKHWDNLQQKEALESFLKSDRTLGIELDQAPLMRFALIELETDSYQFIWSHHHILFDGWSMQIILQEVFDLYESYNRGESLQLKFCHPYREYISWLQQQDSSQAKKFWQQRLKGIEAPTPLVVDKLIDHKSQQETYQEIPFKLSFEITNQLQSLAQKHHLTLNNLVQGAWGLLLSRYSGETDIVFGATVSGRTSELPNIDTMVGLFINTLPVRLQISGKEKLIPWLKTLQSQQFEQEPYTYYSLADIQKNSDIPPKMSLFESILVFENYPVDSSKNASEKTLEITEIRCLERTNYPLTVVIIPNVELSGRIVYDTRRFEAETIERMIGHLQTLLAGMANHPELHLSEFSLLTKVEEEQLILAENQNDSLIKTIDYQCIHRLFEKQVEKTPDAIAIIYKNEQLTYQELNQRANQLAHYLQFLGIKLEDKIGVCIERSPLMVIAILGILKAGGAYVPLDVTYPVERLAFMLEDVKCPILLTQTHLSNQLQVEDIQQVINIESEWENISQYSSDNLLTQVTPDNLAYIIYTSGSTGIPKGTEVPHRSFIGFMFGVDYIKLDPDNIWLQHSSISWDALTLELWPPLLYGGRCVVFPDNVPTPENLSKIIKEEGVNILWLTCALFNLIIDKIPEALLEVKQLIIGGETLSVSHVRRALDLLPQTQIINGYGPSECTVFTSCYVIPKQLDQNVNSIPIGKPIGDRRVYLLDHNLQRVPIGVPGEVYIGGKSVARGYLNQPILTHEKFIDNPFLAEDSLYKTGDLVRRLNDGNLEFLGRIDNQVKIRGFRVELGEIETVLTNYSEIREAIVIIREDVPGNKSLVAYLVPQNYQLVARDVRSYLSQKLPNYMIPNAFVFLDKFPLTANGKINRLGLPAADISQQNFGVEFVAPRTSTERELVTIWTEVLQLTKVGIYDNFFELGGHSLLATQLISRLKETFEIEFPFRCLFENPTISQLANKVVNQQIEQVKSDELVQILGEIDELSEDEAAQQLIL
ncbi:MAG: amino acid adenylation domain-containing protein [Microcystis sp. M049S2]|uniref:non-ribosomal peptide synthetase n=1 Tax=Microcystis sp. M049S2 TaxID=2771169 RepID=UPI00258EB7E2|nr:amino acid adenylation domain-containing protein [Microcystis sp. M049S2]MCA2658270.1 amino acid adenylation domain-containing protein [Microcystis sp. M049S2]